MIVIREATKRDFLKLVEIMTKSAGKEELKGFAPPTSETQKFLIKLGQQFEVPGHQVFLAEASKKPVGFIYFVHEKDRIAIEEVDVVKQYQGRGMGKALVKRTERLAKNKGVKYLTTGTAISLRENPGKRMDFGYTWATQMQEKERTLDTGSSTANSSRNYNRARAKAIFKRESSPTTVHMNTKNEQNEN